MSPKDERIYMSHILQCVADIERYTHGEKDRFFNDDMVRNAAIRQLQTMAESASRLTKDTQRRIPEVDWAAIRGFRNILVHEYLGDVIDYEKVWSVIENRLPELKSAILRTYQPKDTT